MKWLVSCCPLIFFAFFACDALVTPAAHNTLKINNLTVPETLDSAQWAAYGIRITPDKRTYDRTQADIRRQRMQLRDAVRGNSIGLDSAGIVFTKVLVNQIIPYWYGTPWSFEGHTSVPGKGNIACGYFISTTLQHAGIQINRYRLAQQAPQDEARAIAMGDSVTVVYGRWADKALPELRNTLQDGLFFIGLSGSHVGYLLKRQGKFFLLHSNYTYPAEVRIEPADEQSVLNNFDRFYIAPVSTNKKLVEAWLEGREVPVQ